MKLETAVVLVGGRGLRMSSHTEDVPKCMVNISGEPLLYWILKWLKISAIKRVVLGVAYKKEVIMEYIKTNDLGLDIAFNDHTGVDGTGEAFRLAIENQHVDDEVFIAMNGDELTDVSLKNFLIFHKEHKPIATILACPLRSNFGVLAIGNDYTITKFMEKPIIDNHFVNSGIYIFSQAIKSFLPKKGNIEETTFVELARLEKIKAFKYYGFWRTINTVKDLKAIEDCVDILKETREFS